MLQLEGLTFAIIIVKQFPHKESYVKLVVSEIIWLNTLSSCVNLEFLYGTKA